MVYPQVERYSFELRNRTAALSSGFGCGQFPGEVGGGEEKRDDANQTPKDEIYRMPEGRTPKKMKGVGGGGEK